MSKEKCFEDDFGDKYRYALCYLFRGWNEEIFSNDLDYLDSVAKNMLESNSGKPLIIVNGDDKIVREYAKRLR